MQQSLNQSGLLAALARSARKRTGEEFCEMCSHQLGVDHAHLIDPKQRKLICACDACALLFASKAETPLRRVPRQALFLPDFQMSDAQWANLMIPIDLVFFFSSSVQQRVIALYPSPADATESLITLETWSEIVAANPPLAEMVPDVEALLVNRVGAVRGVPPEFYIAPIDECYKLVGLIRMNWRGLSGGTEVWREIGTFFSALKAKSRWSKEAAHA
jgi:hypothetical protein